MNDFSWTIVKRKQKKRYNTLADCYSEKCKNYLGRPHKMKFLKEYEDYIEIMCKYCGTIRRKEKVCPIKSFKF
jgi:RNase P subunit RPR2